MFAVSGLFLDYGIYLCKSILFFILAETYHMEDGKGDFCVPTH